MMLSRCGFALFLLAAVSPAAHSQTEADMLERGEYLAHIMDCGGCHTPGVLKGQPEFDRYLAGSEVGFHVPGVGVAYPPNLTPDPETGLGKWSTRDIMRAVRTGKRPDGSTLSPPMPWRAYSHLTDKDARALAEYLQSLPPVRHETPGAVKDPDKATHPYLSVVTPD